MKRILKVFCSGAEQKQLAAQYQVVATYAGFILIEASDAEMKKLAATYPVEDITEQYNIPAGADQETVIDTSRPRIDTRGVLRAHPAYRNAKPLRPGPHHYLVQFVGPIRKEWLKEVEKAGGEPRTPYSDFTYVVRATPQVAKKIAALADVRWVGHLSHKARVAPSALARAGRKADDTASTLPRTRVVPGVYTVQFIGPKDAAKAIPAVKKAGFKIVARDVEAGVLNVMSSAEGNAKRQREQIEKLSAVHGVRSIRERVLKRPSNDVAAGIMVTAKSLGNSNSGGLGLSGSGEIIAVTDTGIDTGLAGDIHPDFAGRVKSIKSFPITPDWAQLINNPGADDGPADVDSGHGTHVAGSVLGNGSSSAGLSGLTGPIRGLAFKARLVFQAVEQEMLWKKPEFAKKFGGRFALSGLPLDRADLFAAARSKGARIHSISWGGGDPGAYASQCEQLDQFVFDHPDYCILFAAGNDGTDRDGDGKINPMSVTSPGTAKNCITVGACENLRTKFNGEKYGDWWPDDYPAEPIHSDPIANKPDQVVAFSSRGPTADGRVKPDIIAPGTFILSTRSTQIAPNNTAWAAFPPSKLYFHMGGTSMATPLAAGAAAIAREFYRKKKHVSKPSAALIKATFIAGATRLPGTAPAGTLLDNHQGYGRLNLDAVLAPTAPAKLVFRDQTAGLQTGQIKTLTFKVLSSAVPLRVTLAYSDFPGPTLINNLNLIVTAPNGS